MRARAVTWWIVAFAPALAWVAFAVWRYGPSRGYGPVIGLSLFVGVGVLGLTAVFIAYFPAVVERLGGARLARWLRSWWDEDAR